MLCWIYMFHALCCWWNCEGRVTVLVIGSPSRQEVTARASSLLLQPEGVLATRWHFAHWGHGMVSPVGWKSCFRGQEKVTVRPTGLFELLDFEGTCVALILLLSSTACLISCLSCFPNVGRFIWLVWSNEYLLRWIKVFRVRTDFVSVTKLCFVSWLEGIADMIFVYKSQQTTKSPDITW